MRTLLAAVLLAGCGGKPAVPDAGFGYAELGSDCSVVQENTGSCSGDQRQLLVCSDGGWKLFHSCTQTFCCNTGGFFGCDAPSATTNLCADGGPP